MSKMMSDHLLEKFNEIERQHWWWEGRRELLKILMGRRKPKKILDVGCGTGETLSFMGTMFPGAQLYGVDTSRRAIMYSKQRGHKKIYYANAQRLPFRNETFDVVLFLDVLEHIANDQAVIEEAARVLKKNGAIIITSPGLSFIWSAHDTEQGHKRRYTRRRIRKLATNSTLTTSFMSYFNFILSPPIIAIRLLSNIKLFKSLASYDSGINYDIAKFGLANTFLKYIFVREIRAMRYIRYPVGISISAVLTKKK